MLMGHDPTYCPHPDRGNDSDARERSGDSAMVLFQVVRLPHVILAEFPLNTGIDLQ